MPRLYPDDRWNAVVMGGIDLDLAGRWWRLPDGRQIRHQLCNTCEGRAVGCPFCSSMGYVTKIRYPEEAKTP